MVRGLYTAGTGMLTQRNKMNIIANNIANAETTGYKQDSLLSRSFDELMITRINDPNVLRQNEIIGPLNKGVHIDEIFTTFEQGSFAETGRAADLALLGDGFFAIQTPDGLRYTRNGSFRIDENGTLVTAEGYYVQGEGGNITIGTNDFLVNPDGSIFTGELKDVYVDTIRIVAFEDNTVLRKEGESLYGTFGNAAQIDTDAKIRQGSLEVSNVNMIEQIVEMIEVSRAYESNQKIISTIDGTLDKAVNEIGKV